MVQVVPVILSGGMGSRLWPLSRSALPKQFLKLTSERTLIQETLLRVADRASFAAPIIVGAEAHRFLLAEQLREIAIAPKALITEPLPRNTAMACALAALQLKRSQPDALMLVLAADHLIRNPAAWREAVGRGLPKARAGHLVTFGIRPHYPETGYGYIERGAACADCDGAYQIARFVEKPDLARAKAMLQTGRFDWNSGMFVFAVDSFLAELQRFAPAILDCAAAAIDKAHQDPDFLRPDAQAIAAAPSLSVDTAIMEQTERGIVVPVECDWSDVGSFNSLWDVLDKDGQGNVVIGDAVIRDSRNSYVHADHGLVALIGIEDAVVVTTSDAVLVAAKDQVQSIKQVVEELRASNRAEGDNHLRVHRPWGYYQSIDTGTRYQVKQLMLQPGAKISLQKHHHRAEHWVVVEGTAMVTCGTETKLLKENESTYIPIGVVHRLENPGRTPLRIIEVQSGSYLGEDDIVRFEDTYGRT